MSELPGRSGLPRPIYFALGCATNRLSTSGRRMTVPELARTPVAPRLCCLKRCQDRRYPDYSITLGEEIVRTAPQQQRFAECAVRLPLLCRLLNVFNAVQNRRLLLVR
jgi:hypothetical protein